MLQLITYNMLSIIGVVILVDDTFLMAKQRQMEIALSRIGAQLTLTTDILLHAEKEVQAATKSLVQIQQEIEQIYITLEDPLLLVGKDDKE